MAALPCRAVTFRGAVAMAVLGVVAASGCGEDAPTPGAQIVATARCGDLEPQRVQTGSHLLDPDGEPPVPYTSSPPTSGWHALGIPRIAAYDEPLPGPGQVSVLEAGGVVAAFNGLDDAVRTELEALAADFPGRLATTPYPDVPDGAVVLTTWGALQRCDGVDPEAVRTFVTAFAVPDPLAPADH